MCVFVCLGINFPTFLRSRPMQKWIRCVCLCVLENFLSKHRFFYDSEKSRFSWIFEFSPKLSGSHPKASRTRRMPRGSRASILERFRCPENRQKTMGFLLFIASPGLHPLWCEPGGAHILFFVRRESPGSFKDAWDVCRSTSDNLWVICRREKAIRKLWDFWLLFGDVRQILACRSF